jgi:hypothetical protein
MPPAKYRRNPELPRVEAFTEGGGAKFSATFQPFQEAPSKRPKLFQSKGS